MKKQYMSRRPICGLLAACVLTGGILTLTTYAGYTGSVDEADLMQEVSKVNAVSLPQVENAATLAGTLGLPSAEDQPTCYVTTDNLICREDADTASQAVCTFSGDTELYLLGKTEDGTWYEVTDGSNTGWCSSAYVSLSSDASPTSSYEVAPAFDYTDEDLYWLAVAIQYEAGSSWLSDEHQLMVGNVVLNRVASTRFRADTVYGVISSPGQYDWSTLSSCTPSERAYTNAKRLLDGERYLPANVVFQAEFKQGSGVYTAIYDKTLNTTSYFCYI